VSGIFAASVSADSAGIRHELQVLQQRSASRGKDGTALAAFRDDGEIGYAGGTGHVRIGVDGVLKDARHYTLVGCTYGAPSSTPLEKAELGPPFVSSDSQWAITIDGIVTGFTGQQVVDRISLVGWTEAYVSFEGQFAIIGVERSSDGLYWMAKAKPIYALHHPYDGYTLVASQRDDLYGFYHESRSPSPFELAPYTSGRINREGSMSGAVVPYPMKVGEGTLVLSGGGLDTAVATWDNALTYSAEPTHLLFIEYGQRARAQEWKATQTLAKEMRRQLSARVTAEKIDLNWFRVAGVSSTSSLTGGRDVETNPQAGQAHDWFPARNTVLMALALSYAESHKMARIVTGINMEAASAYPDNEMEWLNRWRPLLPYALGDSVAIDLEAPLAGLSKAGIVKLGAQINYPFESFSWSCYNGGTNHCGKCSSCRCRQAAFVSAGISDPTVYEL
jgi:7-cyano-7-deazaguanine synthase